MSRAPINLLEDLHGLVGETIVEEMKRYRAEGVPIPPTLFAVTNKWLRYNGIDTPSSRVNDAVDSIIGHMPSFDDFDLSS